MIATTDLEVRAGARLLMSGVSIRIGSADRVGLVGRNGAGKTTLMRIMAAETAPEAGSVVRTGSIGYLPQDPRTGNLDQSARERILDARGLRDVIRRLRRAEEAMGSQDLDARDDAMRRYDRAEAEFVALDGYAAEAQAASVAAGLGITERNLGQPLRTLSGGQRRRVELARILFSEAGTLLLDEPTNHLDADSIVWLRSYLASHKGGLVVISHDVGLLDAVVNKVFHLDANRCVIDVYNVGWSTYLKQRETDEASASASGPTLRSRPRPCRPRPIGCVPRPRRPGPRSPCRSGPDDCLPGWRTSAPRTESPSSASLSRHACGRTPLRGQELSKSYGSLEVFVDVELAIDRGARVVILGLNGAGKTTLLRILAGVEQPDTGEVLPGHGLRLGYYAQEHDMLDPQASVLDNMLHSAGDLSATECRSVLGQFLFSGDDVDKPAHVLSGGEKTRLALATLVVSGANVLLLDEPTNNLDPASRDEVLAALSTYRGAVILVTHDEGAVQALAPEKVLLLPDAVEDLWREDYLELVALA